MIISQLSIAPIGSSSSVSKYVKKVIDLINKSDVKSETNAMATVIETEDLDTLFNLVKEAHMTMVNSGAQRIITELKIDDRRDKNATTNRKLKAIQ
jgi:uncharacterized protein (TIGR00106 family)